MPHQRIPDAGSDDRCEVERHIDNVVLGLLFNDRSWPWSVEEVARELGRPAEAEDAIGRLTGSGLIHRHGDFVFPTRAARRGAEVEIGTV